MKILLTNPKLDLTHGPKFIQPDWPSLTLPYLAAIMGNDVRIVDNSFNRKYKLEREVEDFKPDIVAFSIIAGRDMPSILPEIEKVRGLTKIVGGQGAHYNSDLFEDDVTVFHDEAEVSLPHYLETGEVKAFDRIDLDDSPLPRWDLVPKTKSKTFKRYTGSMEMGRGCPFVCDFCSIASFWHSLRKKSNERIIEELEYLEGMGRTHVYLADDSFGIGKKKHMELFEMMRNVDIKFFTQIRADVVAYNPDMIKMASQAGLYGVLVGFDSYDEDVLRGQNKTTTAEVNHAASRILRENNIAIVGSHIYGLPGETNFEKTFQIGRKNSDLFAMPYIDQRPKVERPAFDPVYAKFVRRNQFSVSEILGAIAHPNKAIRELKRGGFRRYFNCSRGYKK